MPEFRHRAEPWMTPCFGDGPTMPYQYLWLTNEYVESPFFIFFPGLVGCFNGKMSTENTRPQHVQHLLGQMAAGDAAIYELHVRDFSAMDKTVNAKWKGKYLAFEQVHRDLQMAAVCKDSPCTDGFMLNFAEKNPWSQDRF